MTDRSVAAVGRAVRVPSTPEPAIVSSRRSDSGELKPPLALWIYVARGMARIILSVLALPFV
ncbi:hypothetical protein GCM10009087_45820 [Sphingomonas oligophenolica]|uniref:Uncharacterized protein n=1 Tax=Sphingomonas oligophenolica TaxID=301154 RepID=A0ABU9Y0A5_9SPHN